MKTYNVTSHFVFFMDKVLYPIGWDPIFIGTKNEDRALIYLPKIWN